MENRCNGAKFVHRKVLCLLSLLCVAWVSYSCSGQQTQPVTTRTAIGAPLPAEARNARITVERIVDTVPEETMTEAKLVVKNKSATLWPAGEGRPGVPFNIYVAYLWLSRDGRILLRGPMTPLPYDIRPGSTAVIYLPVYCSLPIGDYRLQFDIVQEAVGPFSASGSKPVTVDMRVIAAQKG